MLRENKQTLCMVLITLWFGLTIQVGNAGAISGLDFPGNDVGTVRFRFTNPHTNGLPIWGQSGTGVTYIWKAYPRQQSEYYTTFFWGNDDGTGSLDTCWYWDNGNPGTYYGAHPYPYDSANRTVHRWEIAADGTDYCNGDIECRYGGQTVVKGHWYTQALRVWSDSNGKHHEFYWDLPNTDVSHMVTHLSPTSWGNTNPPAPALTWGDAPWNPGHEVYNGIIRGIRIYSVLLSVSDMLNEASSPLSTSAGTSGIWYLNMDPTPTDISDKSGKGHNPVWVGSKRPALYTEQGPETPSPPTNLRITEP